MIAAPGAGKGTQGERIAAHFEIPHVATGDLLRDHVARGTEIGTAVKGYLDRGELVPDDVMLGMVREAFEVARDAGGYVLDGIPRTMAQARAAYDIALELGMTAQVALHLQVEPAEVVRRLLARAAEQGRSDDTEEVIAHRLHVYEELTHPILDWYDERGILVTVDAMRSPDEVTRDILTALEVLRSVVDAVPESDRQAIDLTGLRDAFGGPPA
jgi:adenylate kinase